MSDVWRSNIDDATQVAVMICLANFADDDGANCFPGIARIARMTRYSERTVIRVIAQLERDSWITVQHGRGRGVRSEYQVNVALLKTCQAVTFSQGRKKVTLTPVKHDTGARKHDNDGFPPHPLLGRSIKEPSGEPTPVVPIKMGTSESAVDQVCSALAIANPRKRRLIRNVIAMEADKGEPPPTIALALIAAYRRQCDLHVRRCLKFKFGIDKFFGLGHWKDENSWAWDNDEMRMQAEARVGSR